MGTPVPGRQSEATDERVLSEGDWDRFGVPIEPADEPVLTDKDWERFGVPIRYRQCDETRLHELPKLNAWINEVIAGVETGLYIHGPLGTGKSRALAWLTGRLYQQAFFNSRWDLCFVRFRSAGELVEDVVRTREREIATEARECHVLMIDDLGAAYEHSWIKGWFNELIEERYANKRLTCYSSNLEPGNLASREGWQRAGDRMRETCWIIETTGESMRQKPLPLEEGGDRAGD